MGLSSIQVRETIQQLLEAVKVITPQLKEIAKDREFELVITNDSTGLYTSCSLGWDPTKDDGALPLAEIPNDVQVSDVDRECIVNALIKTKGNVRDAAYLLGVSVRSLNKKIKDYKIKL